ncbi:hypothetical protein O181_021613 [Austropuccinia psidii MF-1]|uniref:Uncharacterized protein n=1 Tax=Austropuccinia psidii MF-1 TaxID=1389203 RepID=A0A9Q3GVK9_9BASI|nr:hypothetical protein [Austropuccinia psidii MF-1]
MVNSSVGNNSSTSTSQTSFKIFQSKVSPRTPINFQPVFPTIPSSIPPPSPNPSTSRPALASPLRPDLIPQPRKSPMITYQKLQPVGSSSKQSKYEFPVLFPVTQVFQRREHWPVWVTRKDLNMENEGKDSVARLF